jgi:hypothetical protein
MANNTGNPVEPSGSDDPRDLIDNAAIYDKLINSEDLSWLGRLGKVLKTWAGMTAEFIAAQAQRVVEFRAFLESSGYEIPVDYVAGLVITRPTQVIRFSGELYRAKDASLPFTTTTWVADAPKLFATGDNVLRQDLASMVNLAKGIWMLGYRGRNAGQKFDDMRTVEDFGAVGGGIVNDHDAFMAMHSATGGTIRLLDKAYLVNDFILTADVINIIGAKKPTTKADKSKLENGSIMIGRVFLRALNGAAEKVGFDTGPAHGLPITDGFIFDSKVGQPGKFLRINAIASLGSGVSTTTHAVLLEGWDSFEVNDVDVSEHNYGVVCKSRNGRINGVRGNNINIATVYVKSDVMDGGQADVPANVTDVKVSDVQGVNAVGNTTSSAVYVQGSTAVAATIQIDNVTQTNGHAALRVYGASVSNYVNGVTASNITGIGTKFGWDDYGWTYETMVSNLRGDNLTTGQLWSTTANSVNWKLTGAVLTITDPVLNALTSAAACLGSGSYSGVTVRNAYQTMEIAASLIGGAIRHGSRAGNVKVSGEGNLTMANGAVASLTLVPAASLCPDNDISLTGEINVQSLAAATFATLSGSLNFGLEKKFSVVAQKTDNTYMNVSVYASGTSLLLLGHPVSGIKTVDLSGVRIKR